MATMTQDEARAQLVADADTPWEELKASQVALLVPLVAQFLAKGYNAQAAVVNAISTLALVQTQVTTEYNAKATALEA